MRAVRQLAEHYGKSPDQITEEELRQYFLHLKNVKRASSSTYTVALCGIRFFFQNKNSMKHFLFKFFKIFWPIYFYITISFYSFVYN